MTEREALEQKSFEDLIEIAVAFNLVDREKAQSMESNQLISLIANEEEPQKPERSRLRRLLPRRLPLLPRQKRIRKLPRKK